MNGCEGTQPYPVPGKGVNRDVYQRVRASVTCVNRLFNYLLVMAEAAAKASDL
jgi:hypothetical protein